MTTTEEKQILASVSKLRGATVGEVAADLSIPLSDVLEIARTLVAQGLVRELPGVRAVVASANGQSGIGDTTELPLIITRRGRDELRW